MSLTSILGSPHTLATRLESCLNIEVAYLDYPVEASLIYPRAIFKYRKMIELTKLFEQLMEASTEQDYNLLYSAHSRAMAKLLEKVHTSTSFLLRQIPKD